MVVLGLFRNSGRYKTCPTRYSPIFWIDISCFPVGLLSCLNRRSVFNLCPRSGVYWCIRDLMKSCRKRCECWGICLGFPSKCHSLYVALSGIYTTNSNASLEQQEGTWQDSQSYPSGSYTKNLIPLPLRTIYNSKFVVKWGARFQFLYWI